MTHAIGIRLLLAAGLGLGAVAMVEARGHVQAAMELRQPAAQLVPASQAADLAGRLPDDVDLVLVISRGSELRKGPAGDLVARTLTDEHAMDDVTRTWSGLAEQLGWTREEMFDRLLGQRLVFATRPTATGRSWAMLSEVDAQTEKRLFEKLQIAPRAIDQGHQILAIEKGKYELTSHREPGKSGSTIVLGPAGSSDLFDDLVQMLAKGAASPLKQKDVIARAREVGQADVLLLGALDGSGGAGGFGGVSGDAEPAQMAGIQPVAQKRPPVAAPARPTWTDFAVVAAREEPGGVGRDWDSQVVVRQTRRKAELARVPLSSDAPFEALSKGALLAVLQSASISRVLETELPLLDLFKMLSFVRDVKPTGKAGAGGDAAVAPGRQFICVRTAPPRDRFVVSLASETSDVAAEAKVMDEKIASVAATIEQRFGSTKPPPLDMGGAAPNATRVLPLELPQDGPLGSFLREPLVISWAYPSTVIDGARAGVQAGAPAPKPGWWALTVSQSRSDDQPSPADLLNHEADGLTVDPKAGRLERWVWLGKSEPRAIEASLPAEIPDYRGYRSVLKRMDYAELRLSISDDGDLRGHMRLKLSELVVPERPAPGR